MGDKKTNVPRIPLVINKGENLNLTFTLSEGKEIRGKIVAGDPIPLTGAIAVMQIRPDADSPDVLLELSTANGRIVIDEPNGAINLVVDYPTMEAITYVGTAYYGLETTIGSIRKRRFEGPIYFTEDPVR
ncbi:MAG: hypothetical protein GWN00_01335 [Aliifodinibius sp.]|nr:hypothetical protein [Fodinibius sp.]NIV09975.1 hypothetical protein [Fodinibius sp.]NIY23505.1 hypothetical protein [Fodinibius sp.]